MTNIIKLKDILKMKPYFKANKTNRKNKKAGDNFKSISGLLFLNTVMILALEK